MLTINISSPNIVNSPNSNLFIQFIRGVFNYCYFTAARPIWVQPVKSTTVVEGNDAVFTCTTRSAKGEQKPSPPLWALNAKQMGSIYGKRCFAISLFTKM